MLRYLGVIDRRMKKDTRRTLNDRRANGSSAPLVPDLPGRRPSGPPTVHDVRISEELVRLACLCQAGVLTDGEFAELKARLLEEYWADSTSV